MPTPPYPWITTHQNQIARFTRSQYQALRRLAVDTPRVTNHLGWTRQRNPAIQLRTQPNAILDNHTTQAQVLWRLMRNGTWFNATEDARDPLTAVLVTPEVLVQSLRRRLEEDGVTVSTARIPPCLQPLWNNVLPDVPLLQLIAWASINRGV